MTFVPVGSGFGRASEATHHPPREEARAFPPRRPLQPMTAVSPSCEQGPTALTPAHLASLTTYLVLMSEIVM